MSRDGETAGRLADPYTHAAGTKGKLPASPLPTAYVRPPPMRPRPAVKSYIIIPCCTVGLAGVTSMPSMGGLAVKGPVLSHGDWTIRSGNEQGD